MNILKIVVTFLTVSLLLAHGVQAQEFHAGSSAELVSVPQNEVANRVSHRDIAQDYILKKRVITKYLQARNSPLVDSVNAFISACTDYQLDCYLLPSITGLESSFGRYTHPGSYNPFGWGGGYIVFNDWSESIDAVGKGLRNNYIDRGANDLYAIGRIYAASPTWAVRVESFMDQFKRLEEEERLQTEQIEL